MDPETQRKPDFSIFEKRRKMLLQQQTNRREELFNKLRGFEDQKDQHEEELEDDVISISASEDSSPMMIPEEEENESFSVNKQKKRKKLHAKFSKLLQQSQWLNFVPEELTNFYGTARPKGKLALLVIDGSIASFYDKRGYQLYRLQSKITSYAGIILQVYFMNKQFSIVSDVLCWKGGNQLAQQPFQFRMAWLISNLPNLKIPNLKLSLLQYFPMNIDNAVHIYKDSLGYQKQGLIFVQKNSPYIHGLNQQSLIWKDKQTSQFPIQTQNNVITDEVYGFGKLAKNGCIYTSDKEFIARIDPQFLVGKSRGYIRFSFKQLKFESNQIVLGSFTPIKYQSWNRFIADPLSKLIFQYRIRHDPLNFDEIINRMN